MKKLGILLYFLLFQVMFTFAQSGKTVKTSGTVIDENDSPLIGVVIYIENNPNLGAVSDNEGKFSIKSKVGDDIVFSYSGYNKAVHRVEGANNELVVTMSPTSLEVDEVVVVGLGQQRKVSLVGAITTVNTAELQSPATSLQNMLGGRVAGIISMQTSGEPGKNLSEFWVRGISTFGASSAALVLIDGLEGSLSDIDPADIESFSVLKDASATAVYGVRGANGVVLVTTKKGMEDRLQITARANVTLSQLTKMPDYLGAYDYATLANEAREVRDLPRLYNDIELDIIKYGLDRDIYPNVNWQDEVMNKTSLQHTYYVSARGGSKLARYFISMNASLEGSAYKQDPDSKYKTEVGYNTYGYRSNLDVNITETTKVFLGLDGNIINRTDPGMANTNAVWSAAANLTPLTIPVKYTGGYLPAYDGTYYSPYVMLNYTGNKKTQQFKNKVTLAVEQDLNKLTKGLSIRAQGALNTDYTQGETRYIRPALYRSVGRSNVGDLMLTKVAEPEAASYKAYTYSYRKYHFESTLNYSRDFGANEDHNIGGLVYYYASDEFTGNKSDSMDAIPLRYQGVSSRLTYGYKDTYFIDGNFGYTGSENFQPGRQYGFFPSVAVGWVPTNYKFMKENLPWFDFLKIRGSYGTVGNDRISSKRFPYLTQINSSANVGWGATGSGIIEETIGADNLAWEKALKTNIGFDAKLFGEKLSITMDFFNDKRDGIFQQRQEVPDYVGLINLPYGNVGAMRSWGSDGNIAWSQNVNDDLSFTIRANYTYSNNEVESWEQSPQKYGYKELSGRPLNATYGFIAEGLFKDEFDVKTSPSQFGEVMPGDIKYRDVNGDGAITDEDTVPLSYSAYPHTMYGFGGELRYKNFTLNAMFTGTGRTDVFRVGKGYNSGYFPFLNGATGNVLTTAKEQANRWTPASYSGDISTENPNAMYPRLSYGSNDNNTKLSSFWLEDARYLRLSELSLSYNLKGQKWLTAAKIQSLDIQLVGYNLAVWSGIDMVDPEQAYANGIVYPITRRYALQLYIYF